MLVLSRFKNQVVFLDLSELIPLIKNDPEKLEDILKEGAAVRIVDVNLLDGKVRLGFDAAREIPVHRIEIHEEIQRKKRLK